MSKFSQGAKKAWQTRRKKGWRRKTRADRKAELLRLARLNLKGSRLRTAERVLSHRYRSHAKMDQVLKKYEEMFSEE
jgi:hypothetical protein